MWTDVNDPNPPQAESGLNPLWQQGHYRLRRRVLTLLGAHVDVFNANQQVVMHCHQKAFRLREDIRLHAGGAQGHELLSINARQIIDFSAAYDVVDQTTGEWVGTLQRKGWHSIVRDLWQIVDTTGAVIGQLQEDSTGMALARRFLSNLIPQRFHVVSMHGEYVANLDQHFNPFVYWLDLDIPGRPRIDPRLLVALATLVATIEGRQS